MEEAKIQLKESILKNLSLSKKPDHVVLVGKFTKLIPLDLDKHLDWLYYVSNGDAINFGNIHFDAYDANKFIWNFFPRGPFESQNELREYFLENLHAEDMLTFAIIDIESEIPIGTSSLLNNSPENLCAEFGEIWLSPIAQGKPANYEQALLILDHFFSLGYRRIEFKCDSNDILSYQTAIKIGFSFEFIQEFDMIIKGHNRNTAWFRILDREWPDIKRDLVEKIYGSNS